MKTQQGTFNTLYDKHKNERQTPELSTFKVEPAPVPTSNLKRFIVLPLQGTVNLRVSATEPVMKQRCALKHFPHKSDPQQVETLNTDHRDHTNCHQTVQYKEWSKFFARLPEPEIRHCQTWSRQATIAGNAWLIFTIP